MASDTIIYSLNKEFKIVGKVKVKNSEMGALNFWSFIAEKYLETSLKDLIINKEVNKIWQLFNIDLLNYREKLMLGITLDGALLHRTHIYNLELSVLQLSKTCLIGNFQEQVDSIYYMLNNYKDVEYIAWDHNASYSKYWNNDIEKQKWLVVNHPSMRDMYE